MGEFGLWRQFFQRPWLREIAKGLIDLAKEIVHSQGLLYKLCCN